MADRPHRTRFSRRDFLRWTSASAFAGALGLPTSRKARAAELPAPRPVAPRLLFVLTATGGASLSDAFLAVGRSECTSSLIADRHIVFPDEYVHTFDGTRLRALDLPSTPPGEPGWLKYVENRFEGNRYSQRSFVEKHREQLAVLTLETTTVNHLVGQQRAMNGERINAGRTITEHIASAYGEGLVLPNVTMAWAGYRDPGIDRTLPAYARAVTVGYPSFFALGSDATRGLVSGFGAPPFEAPVGPNLDRGRALMARARAAREELDAASAFGTTFGCSELRTAYLRARQESAPSAEANDLITRLMMLDDQDIESLTGAGATLTSLGLETSSAAAQARAILEPHATTGATSSAFPPFQPNLVADPLLGQAALAYLLTRFGYSAAVTIGSSFKEGVLDQETPLAFDYCHQAHVPGQAVMWSRVLDVADKLITLLKATPTGEGDTMWDRSMVYIATEFGREKVRQFPGQPLFAMPPLAGVSSGHHIRNGAVLLSPAVKGGVYGGIDPDNLFTHGYDPLTGAEDDGTTKRISHVYSAIAQGLDAPFSGMHAMDGLMAPG